MSDYIDSELHYAAYFGDEASVRQCIKSGATVTWKGLGALASQHYTRPRQPGGHPGGCWMESGGGE